MVMTDPRPEVTTEQRRVYCTKQMRKDKGRMRRGERCGNLLCKVDVDRWEEAMTDAVEHFCERCENTYTLAEYR